MSRAFSRARRLVYVEDQYFWSDVVATTLAEALRREPGLQVIAVFDLENHDGTPIYVHAKVCTVDDEWMTIGSDNLNLRSWSHDSELTCAVVDPDGRPRRLRGTTGF